MTHDTIAGVSTAVGNAGVAIIRISGEQAFFITDSIFRGKHSVMEQKSHTIQYGKITSINGKEIIDEVLLTKMEAPRTYTREHVIEINCHGGYVVTGRILNLLYELGARPAEPGEFTKRAFLNGRIDLSQAEAVMDIIQARTSKGSQAAIKQLEGRLSEKLCEIRSIIIDILAQIEVNLDYPEYDAEEVSLEGARIAAQKGFDEVDSLLMSFHYGKILREGMNVVIVGKPNVGKSSLMNRLSRKNKSIVTEIPGTTRDIIEETINIKGIPVLLTDTAGIRETSDPVEKIGVERSVEAHKLADFSIILFDASLPLDYEDLRLLQLISETKVPYQIVFNKIDLIKDEDRLDDLKEQYGKSLFITIKNDKGIEELEEVLVKYATENAQDLDNQVLVTNARHQRQLSLAKEALKAAIGACDAHLTLDIIALELNKALEELGKITGHHASHSVLEAIFSRFCLGK